MEILAWLRENQEALLIALGAVYVAALHIAALTPTKADDNVLERIGNVVKKFFPMFGAKK